MIACYLYHITSSTLICKPRHLSTVRYAVQKFAGIEYRIIETSRVEGMDLPHVEAVTGEVYDAPPHLVDDVLLARRAEIQAWADGLDDAEDLKAFKADMRSADLEWDDFEVLIEDEEIVSPHNQ